MADCCEVKRVKCIPNAKEIKNLINKTGEPIIIKNVLSWDLLTWSLGDWVEGLGNETLDVRLGTKQCTKAPQWENSCEVVSGSVRELLQGSGDTWMYFDYKHMKQYFKNKPELLESLSWADFGFPDKNGKDSTIWIGSEGAYTPCHMDSYGCNIVAQVYGRKLWVMFPPSQTSVLKPTRVPYEESSIYSNIHFSCGLNIGPELKEARVIELCPGDVLVVPKHWWHYVENLTAAISINMWIPLESDNSSRLEESLVRFFMASSLNAMELDRGTPFLNPNEVDLLDEKVDLRQISWCLDQVLKRVTVCEDDGDSPSMNRNSCVSVVPVMTAADLQELMLKKCGCARDEENNPKPPKQFLSLEHVVNAFCHPDVISKVVEVLISMRKP